LRKPSGMLLKTQKKPFGAKSERCSLIDGKRTIIGSHGFVDVLTNEGKFGTKTTDEQHEKVSVRQINARKKANEQVLLPKGDIVRNGVSVSLSWW
jgi:hypothetical protein